MITGMRGNCFGQRRMARQVCDNETEGAPSLVSPIFGETESALSAAEGVGTLTFGFRSLETNQTSKAPPCLAHTARQGRGTPRTGVDARPHMVQAKS